MMDWGKKVIPGIVLLALLGFGSWIVYQTWNDVMTPAEASAYGSIILVGVTAIYAYFTQFLARETERTRRQDVAPLVDIYGDELATRIRNVGNGPARKINLSLDLIASNPEENPDQHLEFEEYNLKVGEESKITNGDFSELTDEDSDVRENYRELRVEGYCIDGFGNRHPIELHYKIDNLQPTETTDQMATIANELYRIRAELSDIEDTMNQDGTDEEE